MTSFTDVFAGSPVTPADVAYRAIALSANLALTWPPYTTDANAIAARSMDITPSAGGLAVNLPPANQVSVGQDLIVTNRGAFTLTVNDSTGGLLTTIAAGVSKFVQLTDASTAAGVWNTLTFGAGTSSADAGSLIGAGVGASGNALYAARPSSTFSGTPTTIASADRAKTLIWTGGAGVQNLPLAATVGSDFWYSIRNQGTGALTLTPTGGEVIDGSATINLQPSESAEINAGIANWYTIGRGRSLQFNFTLLSKSITGGTVTLTPTEAANVVQKYTGVLTSNANIVLPSVVQVYYVSNATSGAFSVTFKTAGVGSTVTVPTGQNAVLFCDGLNVVNASTTVAGIASLSLQQGAVSSPSISYSGDPSTGIYSPASGQVAIASGGAQITNFTSTGLVMAAGKTITGSGGLSFGLAQGTVGSPSLNYSGDTNTGIYSPATGQVAIASAGVQAAKFTGAGLTVYSGGAQIVDMISTGISMSASKTILNARFGNSPVADTTVLDWYEEGTFTPVLNFGGSTIGITYSQQQGWFTRVGNRVFYTINILLSSKGSSSGVAGFTGLPYVVGGQSPVNVVYLNSMSGLTGGYSGLANVGAQTISLYQSGATGVSAVSDANFTNSSNFALEGSYRT